MKGDDRFKCKKKAGSHMRILAVDDDPIILEILDAIVAQMPEFELTSAPGSDEALEVIANSETPFDCFLLDIQMPVKDGVQLCAEIRTIDQYRLTPIVMITAMSDKRYIDSAFAAGATDYLTKPFDIGEVQTRIRIAHQRTQSVMSLEESLYVSSRTAYKVNATDGKVNILDPISIFDVDGLVEPNALTNYLTQLSRGNLFGSGVFAISIRRIEELHERCSGFEFESMIADVAEAISDCLKPEQFLMAYGGNGTFDCVIHGGYKPDLRGLVNRINLQIQRMDLRFSNGDPLELRVACGAFLRLVWRATGSICDALADAHQSAEREAMDIEKRLDDFWFTGHQDEVG